MSSTWPWKRKSLEREEQWRLRNRSKYLWKYRIFPPLFLKYLFSSLDTVAQRTGPGAPRALSLLLPPPKQRHSLKKKNYLWFVSVSYRSAFTILQEETDAVPGQYTEKKNEDGYVVERDRAREKERKKENNMQSWHVPLASEPKICFAFAHFFPIHLLLN